MSEHQKPTRLPMDARMIRFSPEHRAKIAAAHRRRIERIRAEGGEVVSKETRSKMGRKTWTEDQQRRMIEGLSNFWTKERRREWSAMALKHHAGGES